MSAYFNDPSGAFKYEIYGLASYNRPLARQLFFQSEVKLTLLETVSDVTQPSNSTLPHVRSDIAEYRKGSDCQRCSGPAGRWDRAGFLKTT
jgi:hypothetical protein